jgi:hypothetical protein
MVQPTVFLWQHNRPLFRINAKPLLGSSVSCLLAAVAREDWNPSSNRQGPGRVHAMGKRRLPLIRFNFAMTGFSALLRQMCSYGRHQAPALKCQLP